MSGHNPYDYDENGGSGDNRFMVPGLTDEFQVRGLGPRPGDIVTNRRRRLGGRWGATVKLDPGGTANVINTEQFPDNIPIAYQLRFSVSAAGPFTPAMPGSFGTDALAVIILKSIDIKAGAAIESFFLSSADSQPTCTIITRQLNISLTLAITEGGPLFVQAAACPVEFVDCEDIRGPQADAGYSTISAQSFVQTQPTTPIAVLGTNAKRAQFFAQNTSSDSDVIIQWGANAAFGPPPVGVFVLPANSGGIYESPLNAWKGIVSISFSNGGGDGGVLITEGSF